MKTPLTLAIGALAFAASGALADTVRMGSEGAYSPYNFINDDNELDGFERDLGDELCERAGLDCEWVINDWDTNIPNLVAGDYDTIMAGMAITEARAETISFTQEYLPPDPSAFMALDGTAYDTLMESGVIAAQSNTVQAGVLAEMDGVTLLEFPTPDETISAVRNQEVDAVLADKAFLADYVAESGGELVFVGDDQYFSDGVGMGVRQSDDELRETFDAVITEMKEDGSLNELITEWFGEDMDTF